MSTKFSLLVQGNGWHHRANRAHTNQPRARSHRSCQKRIGLRSRWLWMTGRAVVIRTWRVILNPFGRS